MPRVNPRSGLRPYEAVTPKRWTHHNTGISSASAKQKQQRSDGSGGRGRMPAVEASTAADGVMIRRYDQRS